MTIITDSKLFTAKFCQTHSKPQVMKEFMIIALFILYRKTQIIKQENYMTNYTIHNTI